MKRIGTIRTALIGYGLLALTVVQSYGGLPVRGEQAADMTAWPLLLWGVAIQLVMIAIPFALRRMVPDEESAARTMGIVELAGDGLTVLLFAMGTFQAILGPMAAL